MLATSLSSLARTTKEWELYWKEGLNFSKSAFCLTLILFLIIFTISLENFTALAAKPPTKDNKPPTVKIADPPADSVLPAGSITVKGTSSDNRDGSGIKNVEVHVNNGSFVKAVPKSSDDWSIWNVLIKIFSLGSQKIEVKATDNSGNTKFHYVTITTTDTSPPQVIPPPDVTVEATGLTSYVNIGTATANHDVDPNPNLSNNAPAGFPLGTTIVVWTAFDSAGNYSIAAQNVIVTDTIAPQLSVPDDIVMDAISLTSTIEIGSAVSTDIADPNPTITNDAPSDFPLGDTLVTWTSTDFSGNSAIATQTVMVNPTLYDNFDGQLDYLLFKGVISPNEKWISYSTGYGENGVSSELLYLHPHLVPFTDENGIYHGSAGPAVRTIETFGDFRLDLDMRYDQTTRTDTEPKRWEEAVWLLFDHQLDTTHFRYFHVDSEGVGIGFYDGGTNPASQQIINEARNGIQVSRVDGIYSTDPVIKALTSNPPHVIQGQWIHITMNVSSDPSGGRHIVVMVDGVPVYDFIHSTSFSGGVIMVYCENAWISVDNVRITQE